jgi:hypothetical protein
MAAEHRQQELADEVCPGPHLDANAVGAIVCVVLRLLTQRNTGIVLEYVAAAALNDNPPLPEIAR